MKISKRFKLSTTQIILFGFIIAILIGSLLLALPVSSASGESVSYMDALFTATSSISVTGLMTMPVATTWSIFGQVVILIMIQIGGLGVVSIMSGIMIGFHHKMGIRDRILIQDAFNLNTLSGLVKFIKKVLIGTFVVEGIGAFLYMTVFGFIVCVPIYGIGELLELKSCGHCKRSFSTEVFDDNKEISSDGWICKKCSCKRYKLPLS